MKTQVAYLNNLVRIGQICAREIQVASSRKARTRIIRIVDLVTR